MAVDIQSIIATIAGKANIELAAAETAVGTIFSIFQHEAPAEHVNTLFTAVTGATDLAQRYDVMAPAAAGAATGGGLFGALEGALGGLLGGRIGVLLHGIERLKSTGLSVAQIEQAGAALIAELKAATGGDLVHKIVASIPGLGGHIGI